MSYVYALKSYFYIFVVEYDTQCDIHTILSLLLLPNVYRQHFEGMFTQNPLK